MGQPKADSRAAGPRSGISPAAGCALALGLTAAGIAAVFAAASLLLRGDLILARGDLTETRLWLVRENGQEGLGFSNSSLVSRGEERACVLTRVGFLLWRSAGEGPGTTFCYCYERRRGTWEEVGPCPP